MTNHREDRRPPDRREFLRTTGAFALGAAGLSGATGFGPVSPAGTWTTAGAAKDRMAWWREARFGMFVHWGLYSVLAGEWGGRTDYAEWIRNNAKIPVDEYEKLLGRFNPTEFDADRLASLAAGAGAKYLVITTKHHDGFCLFDTKQTDFSVMHTPYRRDIMRMVADACRRHGVRPCWYHSIMDWHHPDYLPRRDWENGHAARGRRAVRALRALPARAGRGAAHALRRRRRDVVRRRVGEHVDARARASRSRTGAARSRPTSSSTAASRPKQSSGLNAKLARAEVGDFSTPEQEIPDRGIPGVDWESCVTMNGNWGYNRADHNFKSVPKLVSMLVETASKGGNLLLNVGPTGEGLVPPESVDRLAGHRQNGCACMPRRFAAPRRRRSRTPASARRERGRAALLVHSRVAGIARAAAPWRARPAAACVDDGRREPAPARRAGRWKPAS